MNSHSSTSAPLPTGSATSIPQRWSSMRELEWQPVAATEIDEPLVTRFIGGLPRWQVPTGRYDRASDGCGYWS